MKTVNFDDNTAVWLKALIYGESGSGKTNFGVSAPNPLILLSERQAVANVRDAAKRMGRPRPHTLVMESLDDYRHVLKALHGDQAKPFVVLDNEGAKILELEVWPDTIVLDSITDIADMVSKEIREQSPQKTGKDGLPVDSERYWNVLSDRTAKLVRAFRDVPRHVLFLALLADKEIGEGDEKSRWVGPQMPMKALPNVLMAAVNVVGITYRRRSVTADPKTKQRPMVYGIATTGPDHMKVKPYPPLRDSEVTDFASWVKRINGIDDGSVAPIPMDLSGQSTDDAKPDTKPETTTNTTTEDGKPDAAKSEATEAEKAANTAQLNSGGVVAAVTTESPAKSKAKSKPEAA
jgi:hypothetical protein